MQAATSATGRGRAGADGRNTRAPTPIAASPRAPLRDLVKTTVSSISRAATAGAPTCVSGPVRAARAARRRGAAQAPPGDAPRGRRNAEERGQRERNATMFSARSFGLPNIPFTAPATRPFSIRFTPRT